MKRRDVVNFLESLEAEFSEGMKHTKVELDRKKTTIPKHIEINKILAKKIRC